MEPTGEMWGNVHFLWELGENDGLCIVDWSKPDQDLTDEGQTIQLGAPTTITPKIRPKTCVILVNIRKWWYCVRFSMCLAKMCATLL